MDPCFILTVEDSYIWVLSVRRTPPYRTGSICARVPFGTALACAMMAAVDASRGLAAAATARLSSKPVRLRRAAQLRHAAPPLKCAFREPDARWSTPPPPEAAATHACPYAELGAALDPTASALFGRGAFWRTPRAAALGNAQRGGMAPRGVGFRAALCTPLGFSVAVGR